MGQNFGQHLDTSDGVRTNGNSKKSEVSARTRMIVTEFIERDYIRNFRTSVPELRNLLTRIPKDEDILLVHYENGFNLLQKCVAENNVEAVQLILSTNPDLNREPCSLPLHIACLKGHMDCVVDLIEHGAEVNVKARMCWPGPHSEDCPGIKNESKLYRRESDSLRERLDDAAERDICQSAAYYAIEGEQSNVLEYLLEIQKKEPQGTLELSSLLKAASDKQCWSCFSLLLQSKADEIDSSIFRYFVAPMPRNNMELTLFHVLFCVVDKPADYTLKLCRAFLLGDLKTQVGTVDYLGNAPVQSLIIRYAFEESKRQWLRDNESWGKKEIKEMILLLVENGAADSVNEPGNSLISVILHQIQDWGFIYDLLNIILDIGATPVVEDRYGHCPLMTCIIKLIDNSLFDTFDQESKTFFMHALWLLCAAGADPNSVTQSSLTAVHVLVYTVAENFSSATDEKMNENFDFIRDVLVLLFQNGLEPNVKGVENSPNVLGGILKLVQKSNSAADLEKVYELLLTLIQYGVNPNEPFPTNRAFLHDTDNPFPDAEYSHFLGYMFVALAEKEEVFNECEDIFTRILYLIYYAMDHNELYKCLNFLYCQFPAVLPNKLCEFLRETATDMLFQPRSLKQLTRVVINRSFNRKPAVYAVQSELAKQLQNYLINYDP